ncbi:50S ribosomal protein L11 methyltransferase [uncultured Negativibacillus sp.]|uniref:50S ribosomal protein L11 methyltransferase n=1 Tax=uncultured Negativibacillus sp. TaxID=1980696 RepID=UPI0025F8AFB5|nr:50S ribosomal protein L11 methyltransferase [uncultured Negativibacillus sp.]
MNWTEVKIYTTSEGIEPLTGSLLDLGIQGFMIEDAKDFDEFLHDTTPHWDYIDQEVMAHMKDCETSVTLYLPNNPQGMEEMAAAREILARLKSQDTEGLYGRLEMELKNLNEEDWSNAWKKYYHPVKVGKHLVVCPSWEEYDRQPDDVVLTLNPGMAFGTGTHDTTRLCMELLEEYLTKDDCVLDVGCGSGILAITAALLGAKEIKGCDIDEVAVKVAGENADLNGVGDRIAFHRGDLTSQVEGSFQVICANIVADVIIRLSQDVGKYLAEGGIFITSGIIDTREQDVRDALDRCGFEVIDRRTSGGWVAMACKAK